MSQGGGSRHTLEPCSRGCGGPSRVTFLKHTRSCTYGALCITGSLEVLKHTDERASQVALVAKNLPANVGDSRDAGSIPGLGRSPGGGNGNPLQYSCLGNPTDRGAWQATVQGSQKSQTQLERLSTRTHIAIYLKTQTAFRCPEAGFLVASFFFLLWIFYQ